MNKKKILILENLKESLFQREELARKYNHHRIKYNLTNYGEELSRFYNELDPLDASYRYKLRYLHKEGKLRRNNLFLMIGYDIINTISLPKNDRDLIKSIIIPQNSEYKIFRLDELSKDISFLYEYIAEFRKRDSSDFLEKEGQVIEKEGQFMVCERGQEIRSEIYRDELKRRTGIEAEVDISFDILGALADIRGGKKYYSVIVSPDDYSSLSIIYHISNKYKADKEFENTEEYRLMRKESELEHKYDNLVKHRLMISGKHKFTDHFIKAYPGMKIAVLLGEILDTNSRLIIDPNSFCADEFARTLDLIKYDDKKVNFKNEYVEFNRQGQVYFFKDYKSKIQRNYEVLEDVVRTQSTSSRQS